MLACNCFNDVAAVVTSVTLWPTVTVFNAVAVLFDIVEVTDTADRPVTLTPFICTAAVHVPDPDIMCNAFIWKLKVA